ncbi:MAG: ABC transporter permease [Planctomycetota bacterium]
MASCEAVREIVPTHLTSALAMLFTPLAQAGAWAARLVHRSCAEVALGTHAILLGLRPAHWTRPVRSVLWRQVYFTGVLALGLASAVAMLVGFAVVLQARIWLTELGQSAFVGPILVKVIVRELAPLLVGVIVIMRSGSAIATELGNMMVRGEVHTLQGLGIDPLRYLVLPRIAGMVVAFVCLNILFTVTAFATGYFASLLTSLQAADPLDFTADVLASLRAVDVASPFAKSVLAPLAIGSICSHIGLACRGAPTEVPKAATHALAGSMIALFTVCVLVSAASYAW